MEKDHRSYVSKALSLLLRHNTGRPLEIAEDGYASLDEVMALINGHTKTQGIITRDDVLDAVDDPHKTRFELSDDERQIRALSGHSFPVSIPGEDYLPEGPLWFGTTTDAYDRIEEHGLSNSAKLKVRLRETFEEAAAIAERRGGGPLVIEVDAVRLHADGFAFSRLSNGEIVTDRFGAEYCSLIPVEGFRP